MRQVLGVDERPYYAIVDLQPTLGQFTDQTTQREGAAMAALQQPGSVATGDLLRTVTAHLTRLDVTRVAPALHPSDHRAGANVKVLSRLAPRQPAFNRTDNPLPQVL